MQWTAFKFQSRVHFLLLLLPLSTNYFKYARRSMHLISCFNIGLGDYATHTDLTKILN